jgi:hypothetical protein
VWPGSSVRRAERVLRVGEQLYYSTYSVQHTCNAAPNLYASRAIRSHVTLRRVFQVCQECYEASLAEIRKRHRPWSSQLWGALRCVFPFSLSFFFLSFFFLPVGEETQGSARHGGGFFFFPSHHTSRAKRPPPKAGGTTRFTVFEALRYWRITQHIASAAFPVDLHTPRKGMEWQGKKFVKVSYTKGGTLDTLINGGWDHAVAAHLT